MNKKELVQEVASKSRMSQAETLKVLNCILDTVMERMQKEEPVVLIGFGTFSVKERAARKGHNPSTGATLEIPAKKLVRFKPGHGMEVKPATPKKKK